MTDEELVKRLRGWAKDIQEGSTAIYAMDLDLKNAASRIEALNAELTLAEQRGYANAMEAERKLHEDRIEQLGKACAEWAEVSQSNYQRAKASEAKLAKAVELLKEARQDLEEYVTHEWPKDEHPVYERKWERDMELCRRIDATLAEIEGSNAP